ncbi:stabilizer of axonemal microtubules 4 [Rhinophrynus dorsalis]
MRRLPLSMMSPQVRGSVGGSCDPLNIYCTSYNTSYGISDFPPGGYTHRDGLTRRSTGYISNLRPILYYSASLDRIDNPNMGLLLQDNNASVTSRAFGAFKLPTGLEPLPKALFLPQSGYTKSSKITYPKSRAVKSVHFDTQDHGSSAIAGLSPKHRTLLSAQKYKGTPEVENFGHGPSSMSSEYKNRFTTPTSSQPGFPRCPVLGPPQDSGYTEGSNMEVITHKPYSQYSIPRGSDRKMIGQSQTKADFLPVITPQELSGFIRNNSMYVPPAKENSDHNLTTYNLRYTDPTPHGNSRDGWTRGGIQKQQASGFTKNNQDQGTFKMDFPHRSSLYSIDFYGMSSLGQISNFLSIQRFLQFWKPTTFRFVASTLPALRGSSLEKSYEDDKEGGDYEDVDSSYSFGDSWSFLYRCFSEA